MDKTVTEIKQVVADFTRKFQAISEMDFSSKPLPKKWSKKEVLGHLIDSAQNNIRRFISGQYENRPKIFYDQDYWVKANAYQSTKAEDLISFWRIINERICAILATLPREKYQRACDTGKTEMELHSLEDLAVDYVKHMKHHINQIIPGSFNVTYP